MAKRINPLEGSLWDKILAFALPLAATSIIQQLFNSCDVATVGQFSGSHSLAAVGSTAPITNLFITIFVGFSVGANVIISRFLGAQREDRANQAIHTALVLSIITGFIVSIIGAVQNLSIYNTIHRNNYHTIHGSSYVEKCQQD